MTETSARFALPLLQAGQAQKELFHNEALTRLDVLCHPNAPSLATATPPAAPEAGQCWIVANGATAAWASQSGMLAAWTGGGWRFVTPVRGMAVWIDTLGYWAWHDGDSWRDGPLPTAGIAVQGKRVIGPQQPGISEPAGGVIVDDEARAAITAVVHTLRMHGLITT